MSSAVQLESIDVCSPRPPVMSKSKARNFRIRRAIENKHVRTGSAETERWEPRGVLGAGPVCWQRRLLIDDVPGREGSAPAALKRTMRKVTTALGIRTEANLAGKQKPPNTLGGRPIHEARRGAGRENQASRRVSRWQR